MSRAPLTIDRLPLFAGDEQIGEALFGKERAKEFSALASARERDGMPPVSSYWGGRFVPAVVEYLKHDQGLGVTKPLKENGVEGVWPSNVRKARA
jgi:hypothetical protein